MGRHGGSGLFRQPIESLWIEELMTYSSAVTGLVTVVESHVWFDSLWFEKKKGMEGSIVSRIHSYNSASVAIGFDGIVWRTFG